MLALPPAQFGASVSLAQRLTITRLDAGNAPAHTLDALLEIDAHSMRLAGFALNQRVLTLEWDGQNLHQSASPLLPAVVDARHVLRDIQLVYWPADAVRAALPSGWSLIEQGSTRQLLQNGLPAVLIHYAGAPRWSGTTQLDNRLEGYRLVIESQAQ
jgi:hypothetical protein